MSVWIATLLVAAVTLPSGTMSFPDVQRTWARGRMAAIDQPQGFRVGLLQSRLLEELNRQRWAPRGTSGSFDPSAVQKLWVGADFVMAFDATERLRFALLRYAVPVDTRRDGQGGWSPARLRRRAEWIARLTPLLNLRPSKRDRYGNVFAWRGTQGRAQVRVRYIPESDELRVLFRF